MIKVGDVVFVSKFGRRQVAIECPVCFGKGTVKLILGNGDSVEMPCENCTDGLGTPSKGYVNEWRNDAGAEAVTIDKISTDQTCGEDVVEYFAMHHVYQADAVFATEEEAFADSKRRADEYNQERETKAEFVKGKPDKNYSWNAGYHMRLVKEAEKEIEYHSKMAKICKNRA